jgi:hypothetical protein
MVGKLRIRTLNQSKKQYLQATLVSEESEIFYIYRLNSSSGGSSYVHASANIVSQVYTMARSEDGGPAGILP